MDKDVPRAHHDLGGAAKFMCEPVDAEPHALTDFDKEVDALRGMGLIQGASLDNAVVLDENGVIGTTLRWPDEFVRHKALDCVGDLALAGARVRARITAIRPSHRGTVRLVRAMKEAIAKETTVIEIEEIMKVLPHRYPFLLVDRVLEFEPGKHIVALKNVTINEPFFQGHFPHYPVMPGVMVIEAMAQAAAILAFRSGERLPDERSVLYFLGIDEGPLLTMIENYRTGLLWKLFMNIPEIQRGMKALGFSSPYFTQKLGQSNAR